MEREDESQELIPIDQQTLTFYDKPLVVVRLADGRSGVVLRWLCDNLQLDPTAQVRRIRRTEAISDDLITVRIQTDGGLQNMPTLVLHAVPFWLAGIDPKRVKEDIRPAILRYQREVVDVLYAWASTPKPIEAPADLVPAEPVMQPTRPAMDAPLEEWIYFHQRMAALLEWRRDIEHWRGSVETRLEGLEAITSSFLKSWSDLGQKHSR
ncbi:MAG: phage antirepressor N-terminal domain-containing protein [Ktedonobacteraceae bacterium]